MVVLTDQPLGSILRNPVSSGRMVKWAVELAQYNLVYRSKISIKVQMLADFIVKCMVPTAQQGLDAAEPVKEREMYTDKASSGKGYDEGIVLISSEEFKIYQVF